MTTAPVSCYDCGYSFTPQLTETRVPGGAQQRFGCPSCARVYEVAFITTTGLELRRELEQAAKRRDLDAHRRILEQYQAEVTVPS